MGSECTACFLDPSRCTDLAFLLSAIDATHPWRESPSVQVTLTGYWARIPARRGMWGARCSTKSSYHMFTQGVPKMGVPQNHVFFLGFPGKTDGFWCTHILRHLHIRIRTTVDSSCMFETTKWWRIPINMFRSHQPAHSPRNITGTPGQFFTYQHQAAPMSFPMGHANTNAL